jgi:hypothetical protein
MIADLMVMLVVVIYVEAASHASSRRLDQREGFGAVPPMAINERTAVGTPGAAQTEEAIVPARCPGAILLQGE